MLIPRAETTPFMYPGFRERPIVCAYLMFYCLCVFRQAQFSTFSLDRFEMASSTHVCCACGLPETSDRPLEQCFDCNHLVHWGCNGSFTPGADPICQCCEPAPASEERTPIADYPYRVYSDDDSDLPTDVPAGPRCACSHGCLKLYRKWPLAVIGHISMILIRLYLLDVIY